MARLEWLGVLSVGIAALACSSLGCIIGDKMETSEGEAQLGAPMIGEVMVMSGGLHVSWTLDGSCDLVEGERKTAAEAYAVVFAEPGTKSSHLDPSATADTIYTYRLRCNRGAEYSGYSGEKSANPKSKSK